MIAFNLPSLEKDDIIKNVHLIGPWKMNQYICITFLWDKLILLRFLFIYWSTTYQHKGFHILGKCYTTDLQPKHVLSLLEPLATNSGTNKNNFSPIPILSFL